MAIDSTNDDDRIREELVAYLDGELSHQEALAVESRLGVDERYRRELQSLERTWNALDELPPITVGEGFTKTTIEMAASEAKQDVARMTATLPVRRRKRRAVLVVGAAAAAVLAFAAVRAAVTYPDRQLARELPLVLQADTLAQVRDVEFLRMLATKESELMADFSGAKTQADAQTWTKLVHSDAGERMGWVRGLSETDKARLLDASTRFNELAPAERESLRSEYRELTTADDARRLRETALAYYAWLSTQTPAKQSELRQIASNEQRLREVAMLRKQQMLELRHALSADDARMLRAALREVADSKELTRTHEAFVSRLRALRDQWERENHHDDDDHGRRDDDRDGRDRDRDRDDGDRDGDDDRDRSRRRPDWRIFQHPAFRANHLYRMAYRPDHRWPRLFDDSWDEVHQQAIEDWRAVEQQLTAGLSDQAQRFLDKHDSAKDRGWRVARWAANAAGDSLTDADLEAFFASGLISDAERNTLLALPAEEMDERLKQMYIERELGGFDPAELEEFLERSRGPDRERDGRRDDGRDRDDRDRRRDDERRRGDDGPERGERRSPPGPPPPDEQKPGERGPGGRAPRIEQGPDGPPPERPGPGFPASGVYL